MFNPSGRLKKIFNQVILGGQERKNINKIIITFHIWQFEISRVPINENVGSQFDNTKKNAV